MSTNEADFLLYFTKCVPHSFLPRAREALAAYYQTIANAPIDITFRQSKIGKYVVTVKAGDIKKIDGKSVTYDYGPNKKFHARVKFEKQPQIQFYTNAKNVYIDWWMDSGLRFA